MHIVLPDRGVTLAQLAKLLSCNWKVAGSSLGNSLLDIWSDTEYIGQLDKDILINGGYLAERVVSDIETKEIISSIAFVLPHFL